MKNVLAAFAVVVICIAALAGCMHEWNLHKDQLASWVNPDGSKSTNLTVRKDAQVDGGIALASGYAPTVVGADQQRCGIMFSYVDLVNCKGNNAGYIAAVNRWKANLGMSWDQVVYWANHCGAVDSRAILVSNRSESPDQVRAFLRAAKDDKGNSLWGSAADTMPILPYQPGIINTMNQDKMDPFKDLTSQIRVSLVPLDAGCRPIQTSASGIMADCLNGWWVEAFAPPVAAPPQQTVPSTTVITTTSQPPCNPQVCNPCNQPGACQPNNCITHPEMPQCHPVCDCHCNANQPQCQCQGPQCGCPPGGCCQPGGCNPCDLNPGLPQCHPCTDCNSCGVPCPKDPGNTITGPEVPGQNGHGNATPGPGTLDPPPPPPAATFTPSPAPPAPTLAPDVTPAPAPIVTRAPDPGVVPPSGSPGSSDGRSDGTAIMPSSFTGMTQSQFVLAA
jgi:hypothetical protein